MKKRKSIWKKKVKNFTLADTVLATCELTAATLAACVTFAGACELVSSSIEERKKEKERRLEEKLDERELRMTETLETVIESNLKDKYYMKRKY